MTARIAVDAGNAANILVVPVHAVFDDDSVTFCYLAEKDGIFRKKVIVAGRQNEDLVEIVSGLQEGDLVSLLRPPSDKIVSDSQ